MPNSAVALQSELHDYAPFGQTADPTALDTAIMALTPWAYWKCGEASGAPQDSSGNARHMSVSLAAGLYQQPAITSKSGPSMWMSNSRFQVPLVQTHLGTLSGLYTYMWLMKFSENPASGSPTGNQTTGGCFFNQAVNPASSGYDILLNYSRQYLDLLNMQTPDGKYAGSMVGMSMNTPLVIAFVGTSLSGLCYTYDIWINGVRMVQGHNRVLGAGASNLYIGRPLDSTIRMTSFYFSNMVAWNSLLTDRQIIDLAECYLDKTSYAGMWVPV